MYEKMIGDLVTLKYCQVIFYIIIPNCPGAGLRPFSPILEPPGFAYI